MPGPLLTTTISESSQRGFIAGPLLIAGHGILELALVMALLLGLAPFLQQTISLCGDGLCRSAILLWMALGMFRSLPSLRLVWTGKKKKQNDLIGRDGGEGKCNHLL